MNPSTRRRSRSLAIGLVAGAALDAILPDPRTGHPVALFGTAADRLERHVWADDRARGVGFTTVAVGGVIAAGAVAQRRSGRFRTALIAATTWAVLGSRSLRAEAAIIDGYLATGDLPSARRRLTHLVGRDPSSLDADAVARAVVESVAENTCDAVVAPLLWGAVAGVPGLVGYRAVNTLDAMVGHRSPRFEKFGWASARLDDLANYVPARVTAAIVAATASTVGGDTGSVLRIVRRDGRRHPSPNSGMSESAYAAALGRQLGGRNVYGGRVDDRPVLGDGPAVTATDIRRARALCARITAVTAVGAAGFALVMGGRR